MISITKTYKTWPTAILLCLLFVVSTQVKAQEKTYNEEITVVAPFDPIIPDAFKISRNPSISDTLSKVPNMEYSIMPRPADFKPDIEILPAVKLVAEPLTKLYRNYLRAGAGSQTALYGELFMSSLRSKQYLASVHLKHESMAGTFKDYGSPANSHNQAEVSGARYLNEHILSGTLNYNRDVVHFYGFKPDEYPDTIIKKDDIKQPIYTAGGAVAFKSNYLVNDKINHAFTAGYHHTGSTFNRKENYFQLTAALDKTYDLFKIETDQVLGITGGFSYLNQHDSIQTIHSRIFEISPYIKASINEYSFKAGFILDIAGDSVTKGRFYPVLEASLDLLPDALRIYAGIKGGMQRTTLTGLSEQNMFLSAILPWNYVYDRFNIYGGFKSNISRNFNFNANISSSSYENFPLFITDTSAYLLNSFTLVYDNLSSVTVKGELEYTQNTKLRLGVNGSYTHYKTTDIPYAWYKPAVEFGFSGRYEFVNKIVINAKASYYGPVWAAIPVAGNSRSTAKYTFESQKIKGWTDISLGAEYKFNKALSFWLNINNLTNSKYYRWYNYRSYGINILGGLSYSF